MNKTTEPNAEWTLIGLELAAVRAKARREKRRYGVVSEVTEIRLQIAMAKAQAQLAIDDAKQPSDMPKATGEQP